VKAYFLRSHLNRQTTPSLPDGAACSVRTAPFLGEDRSFLVDQGWHARSPCRDPSDQESAASTTLTLADRYTLETEIGGRRNGHGPPRARPAPQAHWYRDAFAGEPYRVPFGVVFDRHESYKDMLQPLTFGFRF
jgi:hypothetical protein